MGAARCSHGGFSLTQLPALHGNEAGAEALGTGVVFIARGLIDSTLAPEGSFNGNDGQTVRLDAAISAAFADLLVNKQSPLRFGQLILLATTSFLSGTGLIMNEDGDPLHFAQSALQGIELATVMDPDTRGQRDIPVTFRFVRGDHYMGDPFSKELLAETGNRNGAVHWLAACHRYCIVE